MTVPTSDQATRGARRITLLGTAAVLWVLTWNLVGIWTRRGEIGRASCRERVFAVV